MHLFNLVVVRELQVGNNTIRNCDITGVDTLSAAKSCMRTLHDSFTNDGYAIHGARSLSDSYSWLVFKKGDVTYTIQLNKALV